MRKKQILLINDIAGYGKVATAAMLPILSYFGHPVYNLPTALVSNTLDYGKFRILETTDYIKDVFPIWFPNYTEACYLTDSEYKVDGVTKEEGIELLKKLRTIGTKSALITSISIDGQSSVIGYSNSSGDYFCLPYNEIPIHFPGTGDIFSAILIGHLLDNESLTNSTQKAIDGVYRLIDLNKENEDKNRGIPLEQYLDIL